MNKFTPGPWHTCNHGECVCRQVWSNTHPIAQVTSGKWGDDYPALKITGPSLQQKVEAVMEQITYGKVNEKTASANARLIAAAPDLLKALKELLFVTSPLESATLTTPFKNARTAIAQAEGRNTNE